MPFIPHTENDIKSMLAAIGAENIDALFDEIPAALRCEKRLNIPAGMSEMELIRHMQERAKGIESGLCFIGAGAYEHHIPAAVWDIASRGEFLTAYTPYQAEASQGTLQLLYEFQTMMASLMGLEVSNASLYDGASALAEAVLMAVRANRKVKSRKVLVAGNIHPHYLKTVKTIVSNQLIELIELPYDQKTGTIAESAYSAFSGDDIVAVVIQQPNFFGHLETVDAITDWAHAQNAYVIASVNPLAMTLLKEPGAWGETGADIACGETQPFGMPLASGGPYAGFLCCKQQDVRQMPGRIIGRTTDKDGKEGFALTLQAREQHIRRSKATSNICTNQGLLVTVATIHMALLGHHGLQQVAKLSHQNQRELMQRLTSIAGVDSVFASPFFHESVIRLSKPVADVQRELQQLGIQAGFALGDNFPELSDCLLICTTETKTQSDLQQYEQRLRSVMTV